MATAPPPPPREEDDEPSGVPDAVWEKFAEDTHAKIRATAPKEPSARARQVTERLRREDAEAEATAWRSRARWRAGTRRRSQEPEGWRTGPAWRAMQRDKQGPWRDRLRMALIVVAVAAFALVAINPSGARGLILGNGHTSDRASSSTSSSDDTPLPPETATPTAAPTVAADPDTPTVSHPFAGSPALRWADGTDGIALPRAERVGDVTAQQVAAVLRTTKAFLVASNLDAAELRGGYPNAALRLVDPLNGVPAEMKAALRSPSKKADPDVWFTRYDPAKFQVVGKVIKVRGRMTFAKAAYGSVRVHTDYSYVYPFTKAGDHDGTVARVIVRRVLDTQWYPNSTPGKVQIVEQGASFGGSGCDYHDGYLHPFPWSPQGVSPSGPASDPYDRSKPMGSVQGCGVATRT